MDGHDGHDEHVVFKKGDKVIVDGKTGVIDRTTCLGLKATNNYQVKYDDGTLEQFYGHHCCCIKKHE